MPVVASDSSFGNGKEPLGSGPRQHQSGENQALSDVRCGLLRQANALAIATLAWNVAEGLVAVGSGLTAGSVALIGFGIDSFIETASAGVVVWRVRSEMHGRSQDLSAVARIERRAARIAGALLFVLAAYVLLDAGRRLLGFGERAEESWVGIALTLVSVLVMPVLGRMKLRAASGLGSAALRADAYETITCAWLSATTLAGLLLNAALGWWWADPLAAVMLVPLIVREGMEAARGGCSCRAPDGGEGQASRDSPSAE